jgi:hypothetical protein
MGIGFDIRMDWHTIAHRKAGFNADFKNYFSTGHPHHFQGRLIYPDRFFCNNMRVNV